MKGKTETKNEVHEGDKRRKRIMKETKDEGRNRQRTKDEELQTMKTTETEEEGRSRQRMKDYRRRIQKTKETKDEGQSIQKKQKKERRNERDVG